MKQLSLLGGDEDEDLQAPATERGAVAPADADEALAALARALAPELRLGTSSWSFPGWAGLVYARVAPKQSLSRDGLPAYARHPLLRTVGIDSGFYAPLDRARLQRYAGQVPSDFRFLVKAPALITDRFRRDVPTSPRALNPLFLDADAAISQAVEPYAEGLGGRAGVLLFQFPPLGRGVTASPRRFAEDLYRFLRRLPRGPVYAVELRDPELLTPDLAAALRHGGAVPGLAAHPRLPVLTTQDACFADAPNAPPQTGPLVIRWLLRRNRSYGEARDRYFPFDRLCEPDPETRSAVVAIVAEALAAGRDVFVIVNNKAEGSSPLTLVELARALPVSVRAEASEGQRPD